MSEQGGALARLRAALAAYEAVAERYNIAFGSEDWRGSPAGQALDAALTAAEARIGRLVRFVRAEDAYQHYLEIHLGGAANYTAGGVSHLEAVKQAARAALTAEDLAL